MPRFVTLFVLAVLCILETPASVGTGAKPNVIVVMVDDLEVGTFNDMLAAGLLPNIQKRLVNQGVTFDNSFVTDSLCCPSRATFQTGQYPHNTHVVSNDGSGGLLNFNAGNSLPTWLHAAGYFTGMVGKYLNGYGSDVNAPSGSPTNLGYVAPGWDYWGATLDWGASTYTGYQAIESVNAPSGGIAGFIDFTQVTPPLYEVDAMSVVGGNALSMSFLSQWKASHASQPFFLWLTPVAPHFHLTNRTDFVILNACPEPTDGTPYPGLKAPLNHPGSLFGMIPDVAARYRNTLTGKYTLPRPPNFDVVPANAPQWLAARPPLTDADKACLQAQYTRRMESMLAVNDQIGTIFAALDGYGIANNTYVIFTSDNGYAKGEHRLTEKMWPYEETIRVPLVVHAPGQTAGVHLSQVVINNDLAPTIAAIAGTTPPISVDGVNILPYLSTNASSMSRQQFVVEQFVGGNPPDPAPTTTRLGDLPQLPGATFTLRVFSPKAEIYTEYFTTGERELYDLTTDPYQNNNRAGDAANAAEIARLHNLLIQFVNTTTGTVCSGSACRNLEFLGHP